MILRTARLAILTSRAGGQRPISGNGDTTSFVYDAATGDLLSVTRPLIGSTNFSNYDAAGQAGQVTDVNGQSESFTYDGRGRITVITHQADGSASSVSHNTAGLPYARTDEDGVISSFEYEAVYGRLAGRIDHEGNYITYNYDAQGNMIERSYYDPTDNRTNWKRSVFQDPAYSMPGRGERNLGTRKLGDEGNLGTRETWGRG